jgi:hypothetical protein
MLLVIMDWLPFAAKVLLTALVVLAAAITTECAGPFIGALVVTLPVTAWPAYLFISLDHDTAFVAAAALSGAAMNAVNAMMTLIYVVLARRCGLVISLTAAILFWGALAALIGQIAWSLPVVVFISVVVFGLCMWIARPFRDACMPPVRRRWFDIPVRVTLVCALMATLLVVSSWAGPVVTGFIAVFPIANTSTTAILHPRIGAAATSAMVANGIRGLAGFSVALIALHLTVVPFGAGIGLALALAIPVAWNLTTWITRPPRPPSAGIVDGPA